MFLTKIFSKFSLKGKAVAPASPQGCAKQDRNSLRDPAPGADAPGRSSSSLQSYALLNSLPYRPEAFYSLKKVVRMRIFLKGASSLSGRHSAYFKTRAGLYGAAKPQSGTLPGFALPRTFEVSPANADIFPVLHPLLILAEHEELVSRLKSLSRAKDKDFDYLFMPMLSFFAKKVMSIPASCGMHDYESMGLFAHSLKVAVNGIIAFETKEPAIFNKAPLAVCAALTLTALAHDLGKTESDMKIRSEGGELYRPNLETLADFAARTGTSKLYLSYIKGRLSAHEELAVKSRYELLHSSRYLSAFLNEFMDLNALTQTTQSSPFYPQIQLGSDLFFGQGRLTFKIVDPAVKLALNIDDDDGRIFTPQLLAELDIKLCSLICDHERVTPARTLLSHKIVKAVEIADHLSVLLYKNKHLNLLFDEAFILEQMVDRRLSELESAKAKEELNLIVMRSLMADLYQNPDLIATDDPLASCGAEIDAMLRMVLNGMGDEDASLDDLYQSIRDGDELSALKKALEEDTLQDYIEKRRLRTAREKASAQDEADPGRDRFAGPRDFDPQRPGNQPQQDPGPAEPGRQAVPAFWQSGQDDPQEGPAEDPLGHQSLVEALDATLAGLDGLGGTSEQRPEQQEQAAGSCQEDVQEASQDLPEAQEAAQAGNDEGAETAAGSAGEDLEQDSPSGSEESEPGTGLTTVFLEPESEDQALKEEDETGAGAALPAEDEGPQTLEPAKTADLADSAQSAGSKPSPGRKAESAAGTRAAGSTKSAKETKDDAPAEGKRRAAKKTKAAQSSATDTADAKAPQKEPKEAEGAAQKPRSRAAKPPRSSTKRSGKAAALKKAAADHSAGSENKELKAAEEALQADAARDVSDQDLGGAGMNSQGCAPDPQIETDEQEAAAGQASSLHGQRSSEPAEDPGLPAPGGQVQYLQSGLELGDIEQIAGSLSEEESLGGALAAEESSTGPAQDPNLPPGFLDDSLAGVRLEKTRSKEIS